MKNDVVNAEAVLLEQHESNSAPSPVSSRWFKVNTVLQAFNALAFVSLAIALGITYSKMSRKLEPFRQASPTANPKASLNAANFLTEVASTFLFGSSDGSIAAFVQNSIISYDFKSLATAAVPFAGAMSTAMADYGKPSSCYSEEILKCNYKYQNMYCDGKWLAYCYSVNDTFTCKSNKCFAPDLAEVASIVESVASKVATMPSVTDKSTSTSAMSAGIFRMDTMFDWAKVQMNTAAWKAAAVACNKLQTNVKALNWAGTYTDKDGVQKSWNEDSGVTDFMKTYIDQLCVPLANMTVS